MNHDIIILSLTNNDHFFNMTKQCITSLKQSEENVKFNVILVESGINGHLYEGIADTIITPDIKFNYNTYMNIGLEHSKNEWVSLCNNDLIFQQNWASEVHKYYEYNKDVKSYGHWNDYAGWHHSRFNDNRTVYEGYNIGKEVSGWCITARRDIFNTVVLDNRVEFWFSDNIYSDELQKNNIKHVLLKNSKIIHFESQTARSGLAETYSFNDQQNKYKNERVKNEN